ncbi:hypothetical protein D3C86_1708650 [compost metagenome]
MCLEVLEQQGEPRAILAEVLDDALDDFLHLRQQAAGIAVLDEAGAGLGHAVEQPACRVVAVGEQTAIPQGELQVGRVQV